MNNCMKYLISLNTLIFIISILTICVNKSFNYELYIYTNVFFWILSSICLLVNVILIFHILENLKIYKNIFILLLLMIQVLAIRGAMVSFWGLAGYYNFLLRGDQATYIGLAKDILYLGSFGDDFYPFTGILISTISNITSLTPEAISIFIPPFFLCLGIAGIALLTKAIKNKVKILLTSVLFSVPFVYNWFVLTIYPHFTSVYFLPLILYVIFMYKKYKLIFILLSISIVMWHPFTAYSLFFFILIMSIINYKNSEIKKYFVIYSFILVIWTVSSQVLMGSFSFYWNSILGKYEITTFDVALSYVSKLGIAESFKTLFYMVLDDLIIYVLVFASLFFFLKNKFYNKKILSSNLSLLYIWIIFNSILIIFLFFGVRGHVPDRLINLNWSLIVAPVVLGLFYTLMRSRISKCVLVTLLLISIVSSIITLYPSPIIDRPNEGATMSEIKGADWFITNRDESVGVSYISTPLLRYSDLLYGTKYPGRENLHIGYVSSGDSYTIPNHFNLSINDRKFLGLRYFILTKYEIYAYTQIWKNIDRFNINDFNNLKTNYYSNLLYTNGNFNVYIIDFENFIF